MRRRENLTVDNINIIMEYKFIYKENFRNQLTIDIEMEKVYGVTTITVFFGGCAI